MTAIASVGERQRRRLRVTGVVQGVGFRPHVHRLAQELGLGGFVLNDALGVLVEVEGPAPALEDFAQRLVTDAPPLAAIERVETSALGALGEAAFAILASPILASFTLANGSVGSVRTLVPPDVAVCDQCLLELFDPSDRRYRYPFVNCTSCGPRFTIITALPYDRARTTMAGFPLCPDCASEYADPGDRRFHAEPVACPVCGPSLSFEEVQDPGAGVGGELALERALVALAAGRIVAIKGIGGYHLACDARSNEALAELRRRKGRVDKPFAVMVVDLDAARRLVRIGPPEAELLSSAQRPIVLCTRRHGDPLSALVAPGNPRLGILLPYSPLHHLLFSPLPGSKAPVPEALVMTSGNLSDEPIAYEDGDARRRLSGLADAFLLHNRPIEVPCDDSVMLLAAGKPLPVRRSRGYAPLPLRLPLAVPPLLAVGGELKTTACLASGEQAWMSQHLGDMGSVETLAAFERTVGELAELCEVAPELIATDTHPGYHTRRLAERRAERDRIPLALVQHHHAHLAAVMAEHGLSTGESVVGFAFDGTGYGDDGAIWGGEVLVGGYACVERVAHLCYVSLPGGDAAVRKPYRVALAWLAAAGIDWADLAPVRAAGAGELATLRRQLERGVHCVASSSMGRLFDAVSSLVGLRQVATYEAQAAIELEGAATAHLAAAGLAAAQRAVADRAAAGRATAGRATAGRATSGRATAGRATAGRATAGRACSEPAVRRYRFANAGGELDASPVLRAIVEDLGAGCPAGEIAACFHGAVAELIGEVGAQVCEQTGLERVVLSGGVFQNVLLVEMATAALARRGLAALTHTLVPPNDGGLALGQAVVAGYRATSAHVSSAGEISARATSAHETAAHASSAREAQP